MTKRALYKRARISATKARLVSRLIQGKPVPEALRILKFSTKKAARLIEKTLQSAVANASNAGAVQEKDLIVVRACVNEGQRAKRWRPAPRGRALRIIKRTSHIEVVVGDQTEPEAR